MNVNERKLSFVCLRYVNSFSKRATLVYCASLTLGEPLTSLKSVKIRANDDVMGYN